MFSPGDLDGLLGGTPLLGDIDRYQQAVGAFLSRQQQEKNLANKMAGDVEAQLRGVTLYTLFKGTDPDAEYETWKGVVREAKAKVDNLKTGEKAAKRERAFDSLTEIFNSLSARVQSYKGTLPTQKAFHLRLQED